MTNQTKEIIKKITQKCIAVLTALALLFTLSCSDSTSSNGGQSGNGAPDPNPIFDAYLKANNTDAEDEFGYSVALSADGNTLAVGARYERGGGNGVNPADTIINVEKAGAVYVYTRTDNTWGNVVYLKGSNNDRFSEFGTSVALSSDGNTLAVGAALQDHNGAANSGAVYVFTRSGGNWRETDYITASNGGDNDNFGTSIALSADGNKLAVGARKERGSGSGVNPAHNDDETDVGAVYVYTRTGNNWGQTAYIKASNSGAGDQFGISVALSGDGNTLAVGALFEDGGESGINPPQNDSRRYAGAVYIYTNGGANGGPWGYSDYLKASNPGSNDQFGISVALSADGNKLAVGAPFENGSGTGVNPEQFSGISDAGAVYVYTRTGTTWSQTAYIKASNPGSNDRFGISVALSSDGNKLAVGAPFEDGSGTGIDPADSDDAPDAGAVYVYTRTGGAWANELVYVKASNSGAGDQFSWSVALSGDGSTLAVGAIEEAGSGTDANPDDDNNAEKAGAVYVYRDF